MRVTISAIALAFASIAQTSDALACACCTEPGQRLELTDTMDTYVRDELVRVRFAPTAALFTGVGFPDNIEGIVNPSDTPYSLRAAIRGVVGFEFVDASRRVGRVQFKLPRTLTRFEVDPLAGSAAPPNGPGLYKEWRISAPARLSGSMSGRGAAAQATLILHGGGNSCTSAYDFTRWTLRVKGKGISFTFLGDLVR
jgi:hypothetical protein